MKKILILVTTFFLLYGENAQIMGTSSSPKGCDTAPVCDPNKIDEYIQKARDYLNGDGVEKDKQKAKEFFDKARAIFNKTYDDITIKEYLKEAKMYYYGKGVEQDKFHARDLLEIVCEADNMEGCTLLGLIYATGDGARQDIPKAKALYGKACDGRYMKGCDGYRILNEAGF